MFRNKSVLFFLVAAAILLLLRFYLGFDGLYGQDAYEYLRYSACFKTFFLTGKPPGDYFWGVYYPILGSLLSFIIPNLAFALQLISIISLVVTSLFVEKIIRLIYPGESQENIPFLFFTLSPIVLIHSLLTMSDMLACCFTTVAIYFLLEFSKSVKTKSILLGTLFVSLAVFTRYVTIVLLFPFGVLALQTILKNKKYMVFIYSLLIFTVIALPHLWVRSQNSLQFLSHQWLKSWDVTNLFKSNFTTIDGDSHNHFINIIYAFFQFFHPIFMVFGPLLLVTSLWKRNFQIRQNQLLVLIAILLFSFFLGGIPFQNKRFFLPSFPLVVVFLFPIIKNIIARNSFKKIMFIAIVILQVGLGLFFGKAFYDRNLLEKKIAFEMKPYQNQTLYIFDMDVALQGRKLSFNYQNLFLKKYNHFEKNALVLIDEKQIETQWESKNPALNLTSMKNNYHLKLLHSFSENWNLYQIQVKNSKFP